MGCVQLPVIDIFFDKQAPEYALFGTIWFNDPKLYHATRLSIVKLSSCHGAGPNKKSIMYVVLLYQHSD